MKKLFLFLPIFLFVLQINAQNPKPPYPIIFVHGWGGENGTWDEVTELFGDGAIIYDVCLNHDGKLNEAYLYDDVYPIGFRYNETTPSPNRIYILNFDEERFLESGHENHKLSNESAIYKHGLALKYAINDILTLENQYSPVDKVILVGHSMGGLSIREYLQRTEDGTTNTLHKWWIDPQSNVGHKVARVVTIGTPHGGSNFAPNFIVELSALIAQFKLNINVLDLVNWALDLDIKSEAVRDLRRSYGMGVFDVDGKYLYGGTESGPPYNFYNSDINCDGNEDGIITRLNANNKEFTLDNRFMPLPQNIYYTWITSDYKIPYLYSGGDIVVKIENQWLNFNEISEPIGISDTLLMHKFHTKEPEDVFTIIRGIDEPDNIDFAYKVHPQKRNESSTGYCFSGFPSIKPYEMPISMDEDYFYFDAQENGFYYVSFENLSEEEFVGIYILDENHEIITVLNSTDEELEFIGIEGQRYYLKVVTIGRLSNWNIPYYVCIGYEEFDSVELSEYKVSPEFGSIDDLFIFSVKYQDQTGMFPEKIKLIINGEFINELSYESGDIIDGAIFTSNALKFFENGIYSHYIEVEMNNGNRMVYPSMQGNNLVITNCQKLNILDIIIQTSTDQAIWFPISGNLKDGYYTFNINELETYYFDVNSITLSDPGTSLKENHYNPFYLDGSSDPLFYLLYSVSDYTLIDGPEYDMGNTDVIFSIPGSIPMGLYKLKGSVLFEDECEFPIQTSISIGDYTPPVLSCSNNITVYADPYVCGAVVYFDSPGVEDQSETVLRQISGPESGDLFPIGKTTIVFEAEDEFGNTSTCSFIVTVRERPTRLTYMGDLEGQYSDPVTLKARLVDLVSGDGVRGKTIHFTIGEQKTSAVTNSSGYAEIVLILDQDPCDEYTVSSVFKHDCPYLPSSDNDPFDILPEDVEVEYVGVLLQATPSVTSNTAIVKLMATIREVDDGYPGDISKALVSFVDRASSSIADCIPVGYFVDPSDPTTGVVTFDWTVTIPNNSNAVVTELGILAGAENCESCYYRHNDTEDDAVVVVYIPEGDFITGGGYIMPEYSAGPFASSTGTKANFGFNVKYTKRGNKLQGMLTMIIRSGEKVYQIKSNALTSLGTNVKDKNAKIGVFSAKADLKDVTDELNPIDIQGNLILKVTMTDKGEPGSNDGIGVTLWSAVKVDDSWVADELLYSSNWTGMNTVEDILSGGNLVVHSGANINVDAEEGEPVVQPGGKKKSATIELSKFNVYPNPFNDKLYFEFHWNKSASARIDLYDAIGRKIETIFDQQIEENQHYRIVYQPGNLATNMLYYCMIFGDEVVTGKVIYKK